MRAPTRRRPHFNDDEALAMIDTIFAETWPEFQDLIPDSNRPSGYRNRTRAEQSEHFHATRRAELEDAKEAAREGQWWPLVALLLNHFELDDEARQMLGLRALLSIKRKDLTEDALKWIEKRVMFGVTKKFPRSARRSAKPKPGRPKLRNAMETAPAVQAAAHLPAVKEILKEYYPEVAGQDAHAWAVALTAKHFWITKPALQQQLERKRDPRWRIDLERFRAHLRWLRFTEHTPHLFDE
jgi:hypothetical protein